MVSAAMYRTRHDSSCTALLKTATTRSRAAGVLTARSMATATPALSKRTESCSSLANASQTGNSADPATSPSTTASRALSLSAAERRTIGVWSWLSDEYQPSSLLLSAALAWGYTMLKSPHDADLDVYQRPVDSNKL